MHRVRFDYSTYVVCTCIADLLYIVHTTCRCYISNHTECPHSILGSVEPHGVESQVKHFDDKFSILADKAYLEVSREMEPSTFLARVTYLPVSSRLQHRNFVEKNLTRIQNPVTFEKIWPILNLYWDFLNYGLLEHVINKFGSEDLKHQMQDYLDELSTFKRRTRLCDFIDSWPCRDHGPPEEQLRKVVAKMRHEWTQCTLQDVESFKAALIHKFFLPEFDLILQNANRGCVCVTWLTSPSTATLLQQNLANIEMEFFSKHKIEALTIDGQDCYPTPISGYLTEQDTSEQPTVGISPAMPAEKFLQAFEQGNSEKETVATTMFTKFTEKPLFQSPVQELSSVFPSEGQQYEDLLHIYSPGRELHP